MFVVRPLRIPPRRVQHRAFDRLFDESIDRLFGGSSRGHRTPAMDVIETDTAYSVVLDVPGVAKEQLKVSVEGRRVSVETSDAAPRCQDRRACAVPRAQRRALCAHREPAGRSRPGASQAKFDNGVLTLTLAKKVPTGATQLHVS
jgi:HSP20 family protein